jgi:hypothetical protein
MVTMMANASRRHNDCMLQCSSPAKPTKNIECCVGESYTAAALKSAAI